jgi:hypothetical protein
MPTGTLMPAYFSVPTELWFFISPLSGIPVYVTDLAIKRYLVPVPGMI